MKHITITVNSELEDIEIYLRDILTTMKHHDEVTDFSVKTSTFTERPVKEHSNNKSISNHEAAEILKLMPKQSEAIKKAIEVLEQEPCEDAVSRQAVLKYICLDNCNAENCEVTTFKNCPALQWAFELPSVAPTRKRRMDEQTIKDINRAFKALEERDELLGKIRSEIETESEKSYGYPNWERAKALKWALSVIDKYKGR